MKKILIMILAVTTLGWTISASSAGTLYKIRADGLACPYCAYGIEKKFLQVTGVKHVDIDLKKGLVLVSGNNSLNFTKPELKKLFNDAGFTFRRFEKVESTNKKP